VKLVEQVPEGRQIIQRYGNGGFHVSGRQHKGAILVLADHTVALAAAGPEDLDTAALAEALAPGMAVELLLVGSGLTIRHLPADVRTALQAARIGFDVMNTGAACRTYNLLLSEGRHVAALLFPVD
jgi:uncharacterized protein